MVYATADDFVLSVDRRLLAVLTSDENLGGDLDDANVILTNSLERASADIDSYALRGKRYSLDDLQQLYDENNWTLKGLTCDLGLYFLCVRRAGQMPPDVQDRYSAARQSLQDLRDGRRIFPSEGTADAGQATVFVIPPQQRWQLGLVSDQRYFPMRRWWEAR